MRTLNSFSILPVLRNQETIVKQLDSLEEIEPIFELVCIFDVWIVPPTWWW